MEVCRTEGRGMDLDTESILDALNDFERKPTSIVPPVLENLLLWIAKTGDTLYPWKKLKPLFICKLEIVIQEYVKNKKEDVPIAPNVENVDFDDMRQRLVKTINTFVYAPFTIQRLCELITDPKRYYKRSDKFMRGIEKNIMVVSTVTPNGKRLLKHTDLEQAEPVMNGIDNDHNHHLDSNNSNTAAEQMNNGDSESKTNSNKITVSEPVAQTEEPSNVEIAVDSTTTEQSTSIEKPKDTTNTTEQTSQSQEKLTTDAENEKVETSEESTITCEPKICESKPSLDPTDTRSDNDSNATSQSEQSSQSEAPIQSEESNQTVESNKPETSLETTTSELTKDILDNEMDQS